jgi:hypothetical protein
MSTKREIARKRAEEWDQKNGDKWERVGYVIGKWSFRIGFCVLVALALTGILLLLVWANGG